MKEAMEKLKLINTKKFEDQEKDFKWRKESFNQNARSDKLALSHYRHRSEQVDRINKYFARFNTKANVVAYTSSNEYYAAKIDQLPSSTCWTKEETDCLMYLCQKFNLRFLIIADRLAKFLKDRYDRRQLEQLAAYKELPILDSNLNEPKQDAGMQVQDVDDAALVSN